MAATGTTTTTMTTTMKMDVVMSAMRYSFLFFTQQAYPHPLCLPHESRPQIPHLPPELYFLIAQHISSPKTLKACALTSTAWLRATRSHLFHTITLTDTNIHPFLRLLDAPLCTFTRSIRVLRMREGEYAFDRWIGSAVPLLVRRLERIEVLDIYNLTWGELPVDAVQALTTGFAFSNDRNPMRALRVGTCYWEFLDDFVDFICGPSFTGHLRTLACDSVLLNCGRKPSREDIGSPGVFWRMLPRTLENLFLSIPEEAMLKWFGEQDVICRLKKLGLIVRETGSAEIAAAKLVEKAWVSLEELVLELPHSCTLSVVKNTNLRAFSVIIPSTACSMSNILTSLPALISSISSPHLRTITIHLDSNFHFLIWPWDDFLHSLNRLPLDYTDPAHPKQVEVTFVVRVLSDMRSFKVQMNRVTQLMQRGYTLGSKSWRWKVKADHLAPEVRERGELRDWIEK